MSARGGRSTTPSRLVRGRVRGGGRVRGRGRGDVRGRGRGWG